MTVAMIMKAVTIIAGPYRKAVLQMDFADLDAGPVTMFLSHLET